MKDKSAAIITIHRPGEMTPEGRGRIVEWMRQQADYLEQHGEDYTNGKFVARYLYATDDVD